MLSAIKWKAKAAEWDDYEGDGNRFPREKQGCSEVVSASLFGVRHFSCLHGFAHHLSTVNHLG